MLMQAANVPVHYFTETQRADVSQRGWISLKHTEHNEGLLRPNCFMIANGIHSFRFQARPPKIQNFHFKNVFLGTFCEPESMLTALAER